MSGATSKKPAPLTIAALILLVVAFTSCGAALSGRNRVGADDIRKAAVRSSEIQNGAVGAAEIGDSAVGSAQIRDHSVRSRDLENRTIDPEDLGPAVRLWADIEADGTIVDSSLRRTTVEHGGAGDGHYLVDFGSRKLAGCASIAAIRSFASGEHIPTGEVATQLSPDAGDSIRVDTADSAGHEADRGFSLLVLC